MIVLIQINYSKDHSEVTLPLGILSVGSALKKAGFEVKLININEKIIDKAADKIVGMHPEFVGISVMTGMQTKHSAELSKKIKEKNSQLPITWGGIHPSLLPEQCLEEDYIDYVVIGEGEVTIIEFANKLKNGESFDNIAGLGHKKNKKIVINQPREFIKNLDDYRLDFSLVDIEKYLFRLKGATRTIAYKASRGCTFNCAFCYNRAFNKNRWRVWSVNSVVEDVNFLKKEYGVDAIKFYDDNFFIDSQRALEILEKIDIPAHTEIRIDMITDDLAKRLKELKVSELLIGIESGSNRMLKLINKGYTVDKIKEGVEILAKHDLYVTYSTIVGLPTETKEEFNKTLDLMSWVHKIHARAGFTLGAYLPYPGSLMYKFAIEQGFNPPIKTEDWGSIDRFRKDFLSPWVDAKKVWRVREYFKFFSYKIGFLNKWVEYRIRKKFFKFAIDIPVIEYFAGLAIEEKGLIGKFLRKIHSFVKKFK
ncbi:B12-binding domain-containing radical SAM protein [Patescibacteria group bacterium]|nr:B12-binding domain-containing radical SAM protein [Patescibacteria group bacterium]MBU4458383.1 B12-binding domain-containing radical SAM protein [Patescibacteria group bacterium]MCG2695862.1 B12-binding domain-containing radical SAM protein [Candidatus Portnoybacteria bacterium]